MQVHDREAILRTHLLPLVALRRPKTYGAPSKMCCRSSLLFASR